MPERKKLVDRMRDFFADVERDIFEAFGEFYEAHCSWDPEELCLEPLTNLIETENEIIITADLPYVNIENIDLHVSEDMLHLEATLDQGVKYAQWGTIQRNLEFQKFRKFIKLPPNIDSEQIGASFKNGILEIRIPKKITRVKIHIK
jgi:HSP20 family protein